MKELKEPPSNKHHQPPSSPKSLEQAYSSKRRSRIFINNIRNNPIKEWNFYPRQALNVKELITVSERGVTDVGDAGEIVKKYAETASLRLYWHDVVECKYDEESDGWHVIYETSPSFSSLNIDMKQ